MEHVKNDDIVNDAEDDVMVSSVKAILRAQWATEDLWAAEELCDVTVAAGDVSIKAHKVVLAAHSRYLKKMFCGNSPDAMKDTINIPGVDPEALKIAIIYIYTSMPQHITKENLPQVLQVFDLLQLDFLEQWDLRKLGFLSAENLIEIMEVAEKMRSKELKKQALALIENPQSFAGVLLQLDFLQNWDLRKLGSPSADYLIEIMEIAEKSKSKELKKRTFNLIENSQSFVEVLLYAKYRKANNADSLEECDEHDLNSLKENFIEALNHPYFLLIEDVDELEFIVNPVFAKKREWHIEIFRAILKWIRLKKDREIHADMLFQHVWIDTISQDVLKEEVLPAVRRISCCQDFMREVTEYVENMHKIPFLAMKAYGTGTYGHCYGYSYLNERRIHGYNQPVMYVFGGKGHTIDGSFAGGVAFCQELSYPSSRKCRWPGHDHYLGYWPLSLSLSLMEPNGDAVGCFAFIAGGYAQQGQNEKITPSDQFFRYQMLTGDKLPLANLPQATYWHEVVVHVADEEVWILGGVVQEGGKNVATKSTHIYDTALNKWKSGPDLPTPLCQFAACYTSMKSVLISGGRKVSNETAVPVLPTAYIYKPEATSWEKISNLNIPRYSHSMAALFCDDMVEEPRHEVYVLGGKGINGQYLESIEIYRMDSQQWTTVIHPLFKKAMFGVYTRRWKAELITFSEEEEGKSIMQIMTSLSKIHEPDWKDVATMDLPFSVKGTLILPCVQELNLEFLEEHPSPGITVKEFECTTCNLGPSAYQQATNQLSDSVTSSLPWNWHS